ncbi:MAG: glycosyltransferase family 2 protein [Candidatus Eisenbacteria bacterium]|nr:glycosyltransferase family 2 protein [Candidatus Eisenbacteria bacterium]
MRIVVVIPCKNVEETIGRLVGRIREVAPALDALVVDDGSDDRTGAVAREAGASVVRHEVNRGKGAALKTGFACAAERGYDAVVTMDGDLQHDPAALPAFVEALEKEGADIVVGSRMRAVGAMPAIRIWTNRTTSRIVSRLAGQDIPDSQSGYRILRTDVVRDLPLVTSRYDTESEILIRAARRGARISSIPIESIYAGGVSHINPFVDTLRFVRLVLLSLFWR